MPEAIIEFQDASGNWRQIAIIPGSDQYVKMQLDSYHRSLKSRVRAKDRKTGSLIDLRG